MKTRARPASPSKGEVDLVAQLAIDLSDERDARLAAEARAAGLQKELDSADQQRLRNAASHSGIADGKVYVASRCTLCAIPLLALFRPPSSPLRAPYHTAKRPKSASEQRCDNSRSFGRKESLLSRRAKESTSSSPSLLTPMCTQSPRGSCWTS